MGNRAYFDPRISPRFLSHKIGAKRHSCKKNFWVNRKTFVDYRSRVLVDTLVQIVGGKKKKKTDR